MIAKLGKCDIDLFHLQEMYYYEDRSKVTYEEIPDIVGEWQF